MQRSWIGDRISWVRAATEAGKWETSDPPGAYHVLNGLSMDDMVRVLRALKPAERKKLADNLEEHGGGSDRPRIHLAITNASTATADPAFRELTENLHWAIRSGNFTSPPNGAFNILATATSAQRLITSLNRDSLDALINHRDEAAAVPGAMDVMTAIERKRGKQGPTSREQHLIDLIEGRAWTKFFTEFNGMQEFDQLRFLRGSPGTVPGIRDNLQLANGIGDPVRIGYLLERATTSESKSLYVDAMVHSYSWHPKYRVNHPKEFSRIVRFGDLTDVEIDINTIGDNQMNEEEADRQLQEAKPGPGGFLWPADRNRSTLPVLWNVKQMIRKQQETLLGDEVLMQGIFVVQYVLDVVLPIAHGSAIRSLGALRGARLSDRWMKGSQLIRGTAPKTASAAGSKAGTTAAAELFRLRDHAVEEALRRVNANPELARKMTPMRFGNLVDDIFKGGVQESISAGRLPKTFRVTPTSNKGVAYGIDVWDSATGEGYDVHPANTRQVIKHMDTYEGSVMGDGTVINNVNPLVYESPWRRVR